MTVSSTLRATAVTVIDTNLCQATLNSVIGRNQQLPPDVVCSRGITNQETGACLFDDGGMLACADVTGRYTLTGLVSQYSCGNLPTIYTRHHPKQTFYVERFGVNYDLHVDDTQVYIILSLYAYSEVQKKLAEDCVSDISQLRDVNRVKATMKKTNPEQIDTYLGIREALLRLDTASTRQASDYHTE
ncbi:transmembrane protease serine 7 [Elysia marginata]|uniref:Transmembrane protease serine 7 n=1 Tax=Elysia marginata TaxID=1093978 RepID=A0AAV4GC00_9GAST|nr:transmembrane protease serine 7 [Elysia marginata]